MTTIKINKLTKEQHAVAREGGTEAPFSGKYNNEKRTGIYLCVSCDQELFDSKSKLLVWQGKGYGGINEYMENRDERINLFVSEILKNYPPVNES